MKKAFSILLFQLLMSIFSFSQGKVVINEFMPWTSNTCGGPTAEFVELLNFGPGPMNIGCYVLTDGDFSITIPANTILQPGEFYVISGQSVIPGPCANIDSTITADLNWNTCNCTSGTIPTTGDGLFTDGGMASEQVVLLSPSLNVVDAVIRNLPVEPSSAITTPTLGGQCSALSFDLDLMTINYETIGESAGRGNSFARKLDGDCGWVKDPQQSANATNNTPSDVSDVDYDFAVTHTTACPDNGSIEIIVNASNYSNIFPIYYTLAFDTDNDHVFETSDSYTTGTDNSPNSVQVTNLPPGNYRITVESVLGCNLQTFPFTILDCNSILAVKLLTFALAETGNECRWSIENAEELDYVVLEKSADAKKFEPLATIIVPQNTTGVWRSNYAVSGNALYRLRLITKNGATTFSPVIRSRVTSLVNRAWPNPVKDQLFVELKVEKQQMIDFLITNIQQQVLLKGRRMVYPGTNILSFSLGSLPPGCYQLLLPTMVNTEHGRFHFMKL